MADLDRVLKEVKRAEDRIERTIRQAEREAEERIRQAEKESGEGKKKAERLATSEGEKMIESVRKGVESERRKAEKETMEEIENLKGSFVRRKGNGIKAILKILSK
jgi:vacuolar-type H+-ATPase subunit H